MTTFAHPLEPTLPSARTERRTRSVAWERVWVPTSDAAQALGVSASTIRRRIARGEIWARREARPGGYRWLILMPQPEAAPPPATPCATRPGADALRRSSAPIDLASRAAPARIAPAHRGPARLVAPEPGPPVEVAPPIEATPREAPGHSSALLLGVLLIVLGAALIALPLASWLTSIAGVVTVVAAIVSVGEALALAATRRSDHALM